jgi:hypothetical protein
MPSMENRIADAARPFALRAHEFLYAARGAMKHWWIPALLLLLVSPSQATQTFSQDTAGLRWEAEVTADTFALREKREGAPAGSEFVCPLGPAVRASVVRTGSDAGKVCLVFSSDKCVYKSAGDAPVDAIAHQSGVATFKCLDFATAEQASTLAALINAGPRTYGSASLPGSRPSLKSPVTAARSSGGTVLGDAPQKSAPARAVSPASVASGSPAKQPAKMFIERQQRPTSDPSPAGLALDNRNVRASTSDQRTKQAPESRKPDASSVTRAPSAGMDERASSAARDTPALSKLSP